MTDEKQRNALDAVSTSARADDEIFGVQAGRDEGFSPVQDIMVAIFLGRGCEAGDIGTAGGFGDCER